MKVMWRTRGDSISRVEVVRETAKFVVIERENFSGEKYTQREAKRSEYGSYFDTWEEAHQHILEGAKVSVDALRRRLEQAKGRYGQIKGMKKPENKGE